MSSTGNRALLYLRSFSKFRQKLCAAVMASGYAGLTLGATPTAIANMTAVTQHYTPSPKAFIVVPLVGAFFIDIVNALVINQFIAWLG